MTTTVQQDVRSAAELERQRLTAQTVQARAEAQAQASQAEAQVETQVRQARQKSITQAREAQAKARAETLSQQTIVRKAQGEAEREAEALKGQAREARQRELRKQDLPFTRPDVSKVNIAGYIASVESSRTKAHKEGRSARTEIERIKDEYVAEVDTELNEALADIDKQKLDIDADIAKQLLEAQAEITKQVAIGSSGIDEWETEATDKLNKAEAEYNALLSGIAPYKEGDGYNLVAMIQAGLNEDTLKTYGFAIEDIELAKDTIKALKDVAPFKLEGNTYDTTHAVIAADKGEIPIASLVLLFGGDAIESAREGKSQVETYDTYKAYINEDETINVSGLIDKYGEDKAQVILTDLGVENPYHAVKMINDPEYAFDYMKATGEIRASAKYLGYDEKTAEIMYVDEPTYEDWHKLYFKQPYEIRQSYIIRQAPYLGNRAFYLLSDKEKHQVITDFSKEYSFLDSVLSMTKEEQQEYAKRMVIGLIPVYGTIYNWNNMSTASKGISIALDVATIGLLIYGGVKMFPKTWHDFKVTLREIHLDQRGVIGARTAQATTKRLLQTRVMTPGEAGMTEAEFGRFIQARALNPGLTPSTWAFLERMGQSLTKLIPTISPSEARAFYGSLLPSYAEIIAQGLPRPSTWRPMQKIWKPSESNMPTISTLNQAASLMGMTTADWTKLVNQMLPSKLPAGVQREQIARVILGLASDTALANAAMAMAKAKQQGKTAAEIARIGELAAQSTVQSALQALTKATTLTKAEAETMTKLLNKSMTKAEVKTVTKTLLQAATKADTATGTGLSTKTAVQELTKTITKVRTKTKTKTRVRVRVWKKPSEGKPKRDKQGRLIYPDGTAVWLGGNHWKIIPPPYTLLKPIDSLVAPHGVRATKGTPQETLTFIGGKVPFKNVSFDLGVTDGFIDVKSKTIKFTGGGQQTDVGTRIESTTKGVALTHNPSLIEQIAATPRTRLLSRQSRQTKTGLISQPTPSKQRGRLISHGVYSDQKGTRITRKRHRGWKRIY